MAQFGSEQDWTVSLKESHNNKLSYNGEESPKLGHNHRYAKFLSNGLKARRNRKSTTWCNIVTN